MVKSRTEEVILELTAMRSRAALMHALGCWVASSPSPGQPINDCATVTVQPCDAIQASCNPFEWE